MDFNIAQMHEAVAEVVPDRECFVFRDRRLSYSEVTERTRRLANYLSRCGLGLHRERSELKPWESGQDHLALYLYNGNEYLEGMLGAYKARVAPFNVNYRYVEAELVHLLRDSRARGILYAATLAPTLEKVRSQLPDLDVLIQVQDDSGNPLLGGAVDYEEALASASDARPELDWSPDDLYILYTGGTTGVPKGVLWRQADIYVTAMGGRQRDGTEFPNLDVLVERARRGRARSLPSPPFMHGASHWVAFLNTLAGHTVVVQNDPTHLDPDDILSTIEREQVNATLIVGDAFARPLLDQLRQKPYDLSSLRVLGSGGAPLAKGHKAELLERIPHVRLMDGIGSSESGTQAEYISTKDEVAESGKFIPRAGTCVLSEDLTRVLEPGDAEIGWFARRGRIPLGYLGDPEKTIATFPEIDGVRYTVPGDRARTGADGMIDVYGRDSVTITSGGEKIFAEEVEEALRHHPAVYDAVVAGRPSDRWGQEVVAIVQLRAGSAAAEGELREECGKHIARYKHPKAFVFVDEVVRSPSGKADYRWAQSKARGS
jgi:fatty-acyl-CoA synthase